MTGFTYGGIWKSAYRRSALTFELAAHLAVAFICGCICAVFICAVVVCSLCVQSIVVQLCICAFTHLRESI